MSQMAIQSNHLFSVRRIHRVLGCNDEVGAVEDWCEAFLALGSVGLREHISD
jgi:hypothetical protein